MDDFKVDFENSQRPANVGTPVYDDLSDLEPVKVSASQLQRKAVKMPSDTVSFGPVTAERLILAAACMMVLAMFLPWVHIRVTFFGINTDINLVQVKDNIGDAIFVMIAAGSAFFAAIKYEKKKLYLAIVFFAASAGNLMRNMLSLRKNYGDLAKSFTADLAKFFTVDLAKYITADFGIGFYLYIAGAIFMVIAIILKLIDKN